MAQRVQEFSLKRLQVIDQETGEPMVAYHGTNAGFAEFMFRKAKTRGSPTHWMGFLCKQSRIANRFTVAALMVQISCQSSFL